MSKKVKIRGYLFKLSSKIRVIMNNDAIQNIITANQRNKLTNKLKINDSTIRKYIRNRKYPLLFLKELDKICRVDVQKLVENSNPVFFSKWKNVNLSIEVSPELSYFVGYLQGDGCIESNKKGIDFADESEKQLMRINKICEKIFGIRGIVRGVTSPLAKKLAYRLDIGSLVLNSYIHSVFAINRGYKKNLRIPKLLNSDKEILRFYLRGLFDADGTLPKNHKTCKQFFIDITLKDKLFILEIREALKRFGVITLKPYCRISKSPSSDYISRVWELRIRRKDDIVRYLKEIGFDHFDKSKRAKKLLSHLGL